MTRDIYNTLGKLKSFCLNIDDCHKCELFSKCDEECMLLHNTPNCYDMLSFRDKLTSDNSTPKNITPCGEVKIKGSCYQDFISILLSNGYLVTMTTVDKDEFYIHYGKCQ